MLSPFLSKHLGLCRERTYKDKGLSASILGLSNFQHDNKVLVLICLLCHFCICVGEEAAAEETDFSKPCWVIWLLNAQGTLQLHTFFPGCFINGS